MDRPSREPRAESEAGAKNIAGTWRRRVYTVIFEAETAGGKLFDVALLLSIVLSIAAVMLESVGSIRARYGVELRAIEWFFTVLFTVEYVLRLAAVRRPLQYATSFFGIVDLAAVLPTYLSVFFAGSQSLIVLRTFRLLRVFRVFKLAQFLGEASVLARALRASLPKITVFLGTVLSIVIVMGTLMYLIEGEGSGFDSIPRSMYWAVVTLTTVGYGDITPITFWGQLIAACVMIMGYGIIAVPTGIVTVELVQAAGREVTTITCPGCMREGHDRDATYCKACGTKL